MAQFLRPASDVAVNGWSPTSLFAQIDEATYSDADFISNNAVSYCEVALSSANDPNSSAGHVVRYRYGRNPTNRSITLVVRLIQGTTEIASWTHVDPSLSFVLAEQTLTGTQADSITNYGDLRLRFDITFAQNVQANAQVSWAEMELPDASVGYTMPSDAGSYALTGSDVGFSITRVIPVSPGIYILSGQNVGLLLGRRLTADPGVYTQTGSDVTLIVVGGYILSVDPGAYALTGPDVNFRYFKLQTDPGSYSLTGPAVSLRVSRILSASPGIYSLTGTDALLKLGFIMAAEPGIFTLSGQGINFRRSFLLNAQPGVYSLTGVSANFIRTYILSAEAGIYSLTGHNALLYLEMPEYRIVIRRDATVVQDIDNVAVIATGIQKDGTLGTSVEKEAAVRKILEILFNDLENY